MFSLALKNLLYYRGRSVTTLLLTFISAYFFIVYVAFMDGSHASMLKNALKIYTGSLQIYQKEYRDEGGYDYLIEDVNKVAEILAHTQGLREYSSRLETFGIASAKERSSAIMLTGIDFDKEAKLSQLRDALREGVYNSTGACTYVGSGLAKRLQVGMGDEISFVGSAIDYSFVAELFKVCGIFKTGMYDFDMQSAFVNRSYFDEIFLSHGYASYIVAMTEGMQKNNTIAEKIALQLPKDLRLYRWEELMKAMVELMKIDSIFGYISMGLFFLVILFVIMIYGFINISARIKEFGILQSIGVSSRDIDKLLLYEIVILTLVALALATPLGAYTAYYFEIHPIIIEGMSDIYKEYGVVSDEVPTLFDGWTLLWNVLVIFLLNMLSIIYPMIFVRSYTPTEAMSHV